MVKLYTLACIDLRFSPNCRKREKTRSDQVRMHKVKVKRQRQLGWKLWRGHEEASGADNGAIIRKGKSEIRTESRKGR